MTQEPEILIAYYPYYQGKAYMTLGWCFVVMEELQFIHNNIPKDDPKYQVVLKARRFLAERVKRFSVQGNQKEE
jgi:hypothetical protein